MVIYFLKKSFLFCIGEQPINNILIVSGERQRDLALHIHVSTLPQTPLPSMLPYNTEQSSMCYTMNSCWLSIKNIAVCKALFLSNGAFSLKS